MHFMHSTLRSSKNEKSVFLSIRTTLCRAFFLLLFIYSNHAFAESKIWYVTYSRTAEPDGRSWATAYNDPQSAIDQSEPGDQIWISGGTYYPRITSDGLSLKEGVKVYGGFAGTETSLADRNLGLTQNKSVISAGKLHDYTIHNVGLTRAALLDGFTVILAKVTGIYNDKASPTLSNLIISENGGSNNYGQGVLNINCSPFLINVTITGNMGLAALGNASSSPILVNCAIFNNAPIAAGIYNENSAPVLINCTVDVKDVTTNIIGIANAKNSLPKIRNSIVSARTNGVASDETSSADIADSRVFVAFMEGSSGESSGDDPFFEDPASGNYRLQKCSAAVNLGNNIYYASGQTPDISSITTDLTGNPRFFNGGKVDLGAYEYQAPRAPSVVGTIIVKPGGTGSGVNWECAKGNLYDAMSVASSGDQVWVAAGEYVLAKDRALVMKDGVKIYGSFAGTESSLAERDLSVAANRSILRKSGSEVILNTKNNLTPSAVLDGFTISGGEVGISNFRSSPTLTNLLITGNTGSGIFNDESSPVITNCAIIDNEGAGGVIGIANRSSSPVITNCTIAGNRSFDLYSIGISNTQSHSKIRNCIVYGNAFSILNGTDSNPVVEYSIIEPNPPTDPDAPQSPSIDPLFVDAAAGNYRLQPCSPGVNAGFDYFQAGLTPDLSGFASDLEGKPRVREHRIDMGAYEFGGTSRELADDLDEASVTINSDQVLTSFDSHCRLVAYLLPNGPSPVTGYVSAKVWVASSQPVNYVKRHYQITPGTNMNQATARVTLYFTQQEFTDFNNENQIKLPTNAADVENYKANLRIEKRSGISIGGTGKPDSYIGDILTFKPSEANGKIEWNADTQYWEVTFDVTGFSGFFVKTSESPLPLNLISFTGTKEAGSNLLQWSTANEIDTDKFEIQRSVDARTFVTITTVGAMRSGNFKYSYNDHTSNGGTNYYRLKMSDLDGTFTYSKIISITGNGNLAGIYPNPAGASVTIQASNALLETTAHLYDITGRKIQSIEIISKSQQIDTKALASGLYILKFADGTTEKFIKN
jgi:hypothetical protein